MTVLQFFMIAIGLATCLASAIGGISIAKYVYNRIRGIDV